VQKLLFGIVLFVSGVWFRGNQGVPRLLRELAIPNLGFGAFFTFQGIVQMRRQGRGAREYRAIQAHLEEASDRMHRGETPEQIALALEREYHIAPIQSLVYFAQDRLRVIGRDRDSNDARAGAAWLASDRVETLPPAKDYLKQLDPRHNLFGVAGEVYSQAGTSGTGALLATRCYLYFVAAVHHESFGEATFTETVLHAIPLAHTLMLGKDLAFGVKAELTMVGSPALARELEQRFELPASFAVPWRELTHVGKQSAGDRLPETVLVLRHGPEPTQSERRLRFGKGLNEAVVDNWIDAIRIACALEGRLLFF